MLVICVRNTKLKSNHVHYSHFYIVEVGKLPANCTYDMDTSTLHCVPNTSMCTVQECGPCQYCMALYHKLPGKPLTGKWEFTSHCISLETHRESSDCKMNGLLYPDRCVGTHRVNPYEHEEVLSGRAPLFGINCGCYEANCTVGMAEIKFDFVQLPVISTDTCKYSSLNFCDPVFCQRRRMDSKSVCVWGGGLKYL